MTRHLVDRPTPRTEGARMQRFLELARKEGVHPAISLLDRRPQAERTARKVHEFLRIERAVRPVV